MKDLDKELKEKLLGDIKKKSPTLYKVASTLGPENFAKIKKSIDDLTGESKKREQKTLEDKKLEVEKNAIIKQQISYMKTLTNAKISKLQCENEEEILKYLYAKLEGVLTSNDYRRYILNYGVLLTNLTSPDGFCQVDLKTLKKFISSQNLNTSSYSPEDVPQAKSLSKKSTLVSKEDKLNLINSALSIL